MANMQGKRGDNRTCLRGRKSQREPQPSVEKPLQTSPSNTFVLYVRTEMPAKERTSLNGHCTYTQRARRVSLKSLKTRWWRDRKGKRKEGDHVTEEKLWPRDDKFNITEEACFRGRNWRARSMPWPYRKCRLSPWVSISREEREQGQAEEKSSLASVQECLYPGNKESVNFLYF